MNTTTHGSTSVSQFAALAHRVRKSPLPLGHSSLCQTLNNLQDATWQISSSQTNISNPMIFVSTEAECDCIESVWKRTVVRRDLLHCAQRGEDHHSRKDLVKHSRKFDIFRGRRRSDSLLREAGQHVSPFWWIPVAVA